MKSFWNLLKVSMFPLLMLALVAALLFWPESSAPVATNAADHTCSMHPQVRLPKGAKCPICAMDLVPTVQLAEIKGRLEERAGVQTEAVKYRELYKEVRTVGRLDYNERQTAYITARIAGRVDRVFADFTGIQVKKNDHLVDIYSPDLVVAQDELIRTLSSAPLSPGGRGAGGEGVAAIDNYRLLASRLDGAEKHRHLMQEIKLGIGGQARREFDPIVLEEEHWEKIKRNGQQRRDFLAIARQEVSDPEKAHQVPAVVAKALTGLTEDQGAEGAFTLGSLYARTGQWLMAREIFLLMLDRYPAHRLTPEAARWLIRFGSSSEARRREELKQFAVAANYVLRHRGREETAPTGKELPSYKSIVEQRQTALLRRKDELREWSKGSLAVGDVLAGIGPMFYQAPDVQFCLHAAHRQVGEFEEPKLWYTQFKLKQSAGPWYDAASAELWLLSKIGTPPKPVAPCGAIETPPYLDGNLDEDCWSKAQPIPLHDAVGRTAETYPTEAWLTHDANFLYLALKCKHPADGHLVPPLKPRPRDADVRAFDHVSLLLDLDRDYATCFRLEVDQRGCVCEDCWGDKSWNPKWYVAVHSDEGCWQIEAAIPLVELTSDPIRPHQAWACNVVRTIPGRGVQAFSTPADVEPRPEGLGLLLFQRDQPTQPMAPPKMGGATPGR